MLAELFNVSRRTIGNALTWVRPLLEDDGYTITHSATRYSKTTEILNALTPHQDTPHAPEMTG